MHTRTRSRPYFLSGCSAGTYDCRVFSFDDVKLTFEEDALEAIADQAFERKTGARGLRSIMEKVMMDVMYRIPSDDTITECIITKEAVEGTGEPITKQR